MEGIIIYKGRYGATRQYADSLGSTLLLPVVMADDVQGSDLKRFDFVILGSAVYIGRMLIRDWMKENITAIQSKKIFIFIVCGTSPDNKQKLEPISRENIPEEIRNRSEVFFLHGRMNRKKLSFLDKILLKMGSIFAKDPADKENMLKDFDAVRTENLFPLLNAVGSYRAQKTATVLFGT